MISRRRFLGYSALAPAAYAARPLLASPLQAAQTAAPLMGTEGDLDGPKTPWPTGVSKEGGYYYDLTQQPAPHISAEALEVHKGAFIFDAHVHALDAVFYHGGSFGTETMHGQWDLPRAKQGNESAFFCSIYVPQEYYPSRFETKQALRRVEQALEQFTMNRTLVTEAFNGDDVKRIHASGKMAAVLDIEGSFDLDGDLGVLRSLHRLGLRSAQLSAHNWDTHYSSACCAPPGMSGPKGLTAHGKKLIAEMNRLGMVINISHSSDSSASAAIDASELPVVATHHGLREVNNLPRLMPNWLLEKLAKKGGVFCFQIGSEFAWPKENDWLTQARHGSFWASKSIPAEVKGLDIYQVDRLVAPGFPMLGAKVPDSVAMTVDDWVAVVDKAIQMVGEDHVGFGSDFNGGPTLAKGMRDVRDLAMITESMLRRGYSKERIYKFWGGNLLRVYSQISAGRASHSALAGRETS